MSWKCGAALGQVFLAREFGPVWHVVHPGVFSVDCLGGLGGGGLGAVGAWEKWRGMLVRPSASLKGGQGADRVDGGPTVGLSSAWLLQGWAWG